MEKIELNIVKTPLDPHGRECSGGELLCSPLWTGKVMLVGFLLHEGRIVLGPRFEAFLKSVSCSSVPTLMSPQKQECKIKWTHYTVQFLADSSIPQKIMGGKRIFKNKTKKRIKGYLLFISQNSLYLVELSRIIVYFFLIADDSSWKLVMLHVYFCPCACKYLNANNHTTQKYYWEGGVSVEGVVNNHGHMFGIVPLLFQNSIFYNTVIYCYMCDSTGNVQCHLMMEHSHRVFPFYIPRESLW